MYLWDQILSLSEEEQNIVFSFYRSPYSAEVRHVAAHWIEDTFRNLDHMDTNNENHLFEIRRVISDLVTVLHQKANTSASIFQSRDISASIQLTITNIRYHFEAEAVILFDHIRQCLKLEHNFLQTRQHPLLYHKELLKPEEFTWISYKRLESCHRELVQMHGDWQWQNFQTGIDMPRYLYEAKMNELVTNLNSFEEKFTSYFETMRLHLTAIGHKIRRWKEDNALQIQGKLKTHSTIDLNDLQIHCRFIANRLWCVHNILKKVLQINSTQPDFLIQSAHSSLERIQSSRQMISDSLASLVSESFVVVVQPSKIIRTETKGKGIDNFKNTNPIVQLLVGDEIWSHSKIRVYCYLLNETEALEISENNLNRPIQSCCRVKNNFAEFQKTKENTYCAHFRDTKICGRIIRLNKNQIPGIRRASDENNWFFYHAEFTYDDIQFKLSAFSHPVKIITNSNQEAEFWETAIWDIAAGRFGVATVSTRPEDVPWQDFASALSSWFHRSTGRGLNDRQLLTIAIKMLSPDIARSIQHCSSTRISLQQLRAEIIRSDKFSFWKWNFMNMKLILEHLGEQRKGDIIKPGLWRSGAVGFPTETESAQTLYRRPNGTFLIRFSYTTPGAVTIDFVTNGLVQSTRSTTEDLRCRSLLNRIADISSWKILHPENISKEQLLEKYSIPNDPVVLNKGYVRTGIAARLENNL